MIDDTKAKLYKAVDEYCSTLESEFDKISDERKADLADLGAYIASTRNEGNDVSLTVICTHNSRRSHMGQVWLQVAAAYYGVGNVRTYSGGTEATAFNPRAVAALDHAGLKVNRLNDGDNPPYDLSYGKGFEPMTMFSKKFDHRMNPTSNFAAVMVCSQADEACPIVPGANARFSIPYEDPKVSDGTSEEEETYQARSRQIAREMFYAMQQAKGAINTK